MHVLSKVACATTWFVLFLVVGITTISYLTLFSYYSSHNCVLVNKQFTISNNTIYTAVYTYIKNTTIYCPNCNCCHNCSFENAYEFMVYNQSEFNEHYNNYTVNVTNVQCYEHKNNLYISWNKINNNIHIAIILQVVTISAMAIVAVLYNIYYNKWSRRFLH